MSAKTIRNALGVLQDEPDSEEAWAKLDEALSASDGPHGAELADLLAGARRAHEARREDDAVVRLLEREAKALAGTPAEADRVAELARVLDEEVLDDAASVAAYDRLLALRPGDVRAEEALERSKARRGKWLELTKRYIEESKGAGEAAFKSSLLVSAAEVAYRFGRPALAADTGEGKDGKKGRKKLDALMKQILEGLSRALEVDAKNRRAALLLERVRRELGDVDGTVTVLEHLASENHAKEERVAALLRLARVHKRRGDKRAAASAYERVLDLAPAHQEATAALVEHFNEHEDWDHLVALYEEQLAVRGRAGGDPGMLLQLGMVHWKMRGRPAQAEPFFERLRKIEPAHPTTLEFFRAYLSETGDTTRLTAVLGDAQRAMPEGPARSSLVAELARLNEEGANATKAIEQWRALLRQDPSNQHARDALKRLYRQTAAWNPLAELLRTDIERIPADDRAARLPLLREVAGVYAEHLKNDSALVTVLGQIVALDPSDIDAVRESVRVYAALGRGRDLLAAQERLAELEPEPEAKAVLYREVARHWLDQFSNVQNALEAYEKLYAATPGDAEANEKLRELYTKRRAYRPLFELLRGQAERAEDAPARHALWMEMARLAAERLEDGAAAVGLFKRILTEDPGSGSALDALEKQAERDKDFATVAEALERRVDLIESVDERLATLQKLGTIYADRLHDAEGSARAYRRVLELAPGNPKALRVLRESLLAAGDFDGVTALYAETKDWEGLAEVLSSAADKTSDLDRRIALSFRAADVYVDKLKAPERAQRAYERVLLARPDDPRAAAALVPLYEADEKWSKVAPLYEVLLAYTTDDDDKLALEQKLARVLGERLQDKKGAFSWARKAYELDPEREGALAELVVAARASAEWDEFIAVLAARAKGKKGKKEEKLRIRRVLASTYADLGRIEEAIETYKRLIEDDEEDEESVQALDRLLRRKLDADELRGLFELRVGRANTAQKIQLLVEWAGLEEDSFGAPDRAVTVYRRLLEIVPQHGAALRAVARLLRSTGDAEGAATALERDRDQREGLERAQREVELAKLYATSLKRTNDALAAVKRAIDLATPEAGGAPPLELDSAIAVLEDLLQVPETRGRAAELLDTAYTVARQPAKRADVLEVMIATAASKGDRLQLFGRLADLFEGPLADMPRAFHVVARAAGEFPTELPLWDRLGVLANKIDRFSAFVDAIVEAVPPTGDTGLPVAVELDLAERAATLYDERLGNLVQAQPYLERILRHDPENERAFGRLKQILTTLERWSDLEGVYERAIGASTDRPRQTELLSEVALVAEEITGDRPKAIGYYERILDIEPEHDGAARALESLYAREARWQDLAKLLRARLERAGEDDGVTLKLRLGVLYAGQLSDPPTALEFLEAVLEARPTERSAEEIVEKMLDNPELRARAAAVLEGAYVAQDAARDLVRVLEIRLETVDHPLTRRELLRRVAELRDERLQEGALEAYARLVPVAPDDAHARERLLELARRIGAHDEAARVLAESAKVAEAPQPRAEILAEVARIYEDVLDDPARAKGVFREILELDPDDADLVLPAARSLERIYQASGESTELATILRVEVKLEEDPTRRRDLLGKLGNLSENALGDPSAAIEAWKMRLEDDPLDEEALAALDRLYERTSAWRPLVEVLRARERHTDDTSARRTLMTRVAVTLADKLSDVAEAILAYRALLDEFGPERSVLAALATLCEVAERHEELAEILEMDLELAEETADRLALLARLAEVREGRLKELPAALETYRQALALDTSHAPSRKALERLLDDENVRQEAASILRPLYEAEGAHEPLLRVLDIEADYEDSIDGKLALYEQAARVAEQDLHDPARAFAYAARGLRAAVGEADLPAWLERAERLASATGKQAELVALLEEVVAEITDDDVALDVTLKIAALARTTLSDPEKARTHYRKALERRGDERRALVALEELYEEAKDWPALLEILRQRAEHAADDAERKKILFKDAELCAGPLEDKAGAIEVYEEILAIGPDGRAFAALEALYRDTEAFERLVELFERQIELGGPAEERAGLHHKLGMVLHEKMGDGERAFEQLEEALRLDGQHPATVAALEAWMQDRTYAAQSAEMLEQVYLQRLDWRKVMATIEARLAVSQDPDERRTLLRRLAKLYEEQEENYRAALETTAKLLAEDITDEPTWAELERFARVANAEARLAEIFSTELEKIPTDEATTARLAFRTGELFEAQKDLERALTFYRRAYAFAPDESQAAFRSVDRLLEQLGRHADRVELYRGALEYREDPTERIATLHTIAAIQEKSLNDAAAAIETYKEAAEVEETDGPTLDALMRLYAANERFADLAELLRARAEQSALPDDEAKYRLDLGHLLDERIGDVGLAIDEYQNVVEVAPTSLAAREAVAALEKLLEVPEHKPRVSEILRPIYERADDWRRLVALNAERHAIARDDEERVVILRETARLWEERGKDLDKAFEAARDAFVIDPADGESRADLDRLAEIGRGGAGRWDDLATAYEQGIERAADDLTRKELLGALARLHDQRRDDPRRALDAWDRLFRIDETDEAPLEEMDALATLLSDWSILVRVLAKKAELTPSDEERASTWRRIGEARRDMLDDPQGAIDAYERALELEPESAFTLDNLIALYEDKNDSARLVGLYRRRVELCGEDDEGLKFTLLTDMATRHERGLDDRRSAIEALHEALEVRPGDRDVVTRLDALYAAERMWPELLENLRQQVGMTDDPEARRLLQRRIGALLAGELDEPQQALDAYREIVVGGFDDVAVQAIRRLGETRDELRLEATEVLEPALRTAGRYEELLEILELRLRAQTEPTDRAATLRASAEVAENHLSDARRAEDLLVRALVEAPTDAELHAEIERLAGRAGEEGWRRYADALAERIAGLFDAEGNADLCVRLGRVAEEHLRDDARAAKAYASAAEQRGDESSILEALDRIYGKLGDGRALADVLERRIGIAEDDAGWADLQHRLASLQIEAFDEKSRALSTLRGALERVASHEPSRATMERLLDEPSLFEEAFEVLEGVYRELALYERLASLFERRVARAAGSDDKTQARLDLARILEDNVKDAGRAQRVIEAALDDDPTNEDLLAELTRLADVSDGGWGKAAAALEATLVRRGDELAAGRRAQLWFRLAGWRRDRLADSEAAERALTTARQADPQDLEILRGLEELRRAPGRERELVDTLRARAALEGSLETKRELFREAKEKAEALGDAALAETSLRSLLAEDEADAWALAELTRLREAAGDQAEVVTLLLRRAEIEADGAVVRSLRHRAATVLEGQSEAGRAIELYEGLLEDDPTDVAAAERLRHLYGATGRSRDLVALLERLVDTAEGAAQRIELRMALAKLRESLEEDAEARQVYAAVLEEEPGHTEAVLALSALLERTGQHEDLAELLQKEIERAEAQSDREAELALRVRVGEVYEGKLGDTGRALAAYEATLEREPTHRGALEAVARLAESREDYGRAATALERLLEGATDATAVPWATRLVAARQKLGDDAGIEAALRRALALDPHHHESRAALAAHYERVKDFGALAAHLVEDADAITREHPDEVVPPPPPPVAGTSLRPAPGGSMRPPGGSLRPGSLPPPAPTNDRVLEVVALLRRAAEIHLRERNAPDDAAPLLERASALVPLDRDLLLVLCEAYSIAGRDRDAAGVLERVIASFGAKRTKELSTYHHRLAGVLQKLGEKEAALAQLELAFKVDPGSIAVLKDLGVLAFETDDLDRAQKTFRALLLQRLDPGGGLSKGEVFCYLGEISLKQGDKTKAVQMFERALENDPGLARAKEKLAEAKG